MSADQMRDEIKQHGISAIGRSEYIRYLDGKRLTQQKMIRAMCYRCNCGYQDGKRDCGIEDCPLYSSMPYRNVPEDAVEHMPEKNIPETTTGIGLGEKNSGTHPTQQILEVEQCQ